MLSLTLLQRNVNQSMWSCEEKLKGKEKLKDKEKLKGKAVLCSSASQEWPAPADRHLPYTQQKPGVQGTMAALRLGQGQSVCTSPRLVRPVLDQTCSPNLVKSWVHIWPNRRHMFGQIYDHFARHKAHPWPGL